MGLVVNTPTDLLDHVGEDLGYSDWLEVPQADVDAFARATHDLQWIHIDVERAKAGPFGGTIVHGYMTLSLVVPLASGLITVERRSMGVNYGLNKVRFPAPLPVGSRIRAHGRLADVAQVQGGVQVTTDITIEREGGDKPVCVAQTLSRQYD